MADNPDAALVLFSGGQDSTVCLAWALQRFARVETVGFAYRQRHAVELAVRPRVRERLTALEKAAPPAGEVPTLRARLAELERRLAAEPVADVAALRSQLKEEETFRAAFMQRIQALEGARYRAQEDAKLAAQKIAAAEKVPWAQERAELQGRLAALEKELNRLRAINENSRSEWTATLARQDALRLTEIAGLKRELEELRPDRSPG